MLSGFPWNVLGYALTYPLPLMQSAAVLGIYGLTLCAVMIFALPPVLWSDAVYGPAGRGARRSALAVAVLPLLLTALAGQARLALEAVVPSNWYVETQEPIMIDRLFCAVLTFTLLVGGTLAVGSAMVDYDRRAAHQSALPVIVLPTVTVTGKRDAEPAAIAQRDGAEPGTNKLQ